MDRYGSEPIEGLTVWGKWDSESYAKHNEDLEGEHGWSHFKSEYLVHHETTCLPASLEKENEIFSIMENGGGYMLCDISRRICRAIQNECWIDVMKLRGEEVRNGGWEEHSELPSP